MTIIFILILLLWINDLTDDIRKLKNRIKELEKKE